MNEWKVSQTSFALVVAAPSAVVAIASISIRYALANKGPMISLRPITDPTVALRNLPMMRAVYLTLSYIAATGSNGGMAKWADHSPFRAKRN